MMVGLVLCCTTETAPLRRVVEGSTLACTDVGRQIGSDIPDFTHRLRVHGGAQYAEQHGATVLIPVLLDALGDRVWVVFLLAGIYERIDLSGNGASRRCGHRRANVFDVPVMCRSRGTAAS